MSLIEPPPSAVDERVSGSIPLGLAFGVVAWTLLGLWTAFVPATKTERANLIVLVVLVAPLGGALFALVLSYFDRAGVPDAVRWFARTTGYAAIAPMMILAMALHRPRKNPG